MADGKSVHVPLDPLSEVHGEFVAAGIDGLLSWLRDAEGALDAMKPISLAEETLNEQAKQFQVRETCIIAPNTWCYTCIVAPL